MSTGYQPGALALPNVAQDAQASALNGLNLGQKMATFSALRGIDLNNPGSVDQGIQNLIHVGALDQASAALSLGFQRYVIGARQQGISGLITALGNQSSGGDMGQGQPQQPDQQPTTQTPSPQQIAQQRAFITFGKQSADELASVAAQGDPAKTQAAAADIKAHGLQMGVPEQFLDSALQVTGDPQTDAAHFQGLSQNYGQWLAHQSMGGDGTGAQPDLHPTTMSVVNSGDLYSHPGLREAVATLAATGMDTKELTNALTAGRYSGIAAPGQVVVNNGVPTYQAPYAPVDLAPGHPLVNPNNGETIAKAPFEPTVTPIPPANRPLVFNPNDALSGGQPATATTPPNAPGTPTKESGAPSPYVNGGATTLTPRTAALVPITVPGANSIRINAGIAPQVESLLKDLREAGAPVGNLVGADDHSLDVAGTNTTSAHKVGLAFDDKAGAAWLAAHPQQAREIAAANGARWGGDFKDVGPDPEHFTWSKVPGVPGGTVVWNPKTGAFGDASAPQAQPAQESAPNGLPGVSLGEAAPAYGPVTTLPGIPGKVQVQAGGQISPVANTAPSAGDVFGLRGKTMDSQEYKAAQAGLSAWQALKAIAPQMTGPAAYTILDNFARAINPPGMARPTTIRAIVDQLGLPNQVAGFIEGAAGQGALTPQARQQIMDAVYENVVAHYDQAKQQNDYNSDYVKRHPEYGVQAQDVVAPLAPRPNRFLLVAPPAADRVKGQVYDTPKGPHVWTGTGWQTAQQ